MSADNESRTQTGGLSWVSHLQTYVRTVLASCACPAQANSRKVLSDIVLDNPNSADAWYNFLEHEEACIRQGGPAAEAAAGLTRDTEPGKASGVSLYHLYHKATELVQRSKGKPLDAYVKIWVGYARLQWQHNEDEARDTFKTLKNQHIADSNAFLFHAWASLESESGNTTKALGILGKAIKEKAQPDSLLQGLLSELQGQSQPSTQPPTAAAAAPAPHPKTPHSQGAAFGHHAPSATPLPLAQQQASLLKQPPSSSAAQGQFKTPLPLPNHTSHSASSHSSAGSLTGGSALTGGLQTGGSITQHATPPLPSMHEPLPTQRQQYLPPSSANRGLPQQPSSYTSQPGSLSHSVHAVPPPASVSSRPRHSLTSSEEDHLFSKGSDNTATMTSATATLDADVSLRSMHFDAVREESCPPGSAHQAHGGSGEGNLTARGDGNHTGGVNITGGLNHTGQMGIKRFGFKSKALRVTHGSEGADRAVMDTDAPAAMLGTSPTLETVTAAAADLSARAAIGGVGSIDQEGVMADAEIRGTPPSHSVPSTSHATGGTAGEMGSGRSLWGLDGENSASRKRRAGNSGHPSPRNPMVVEGSAKRRTSLLVSATANTGVQPSNTAPPATDAGHGFALPHLPTHHTNLSPSAPSPPLAISPPSLLHSAAAPAVTPPAAPHSAANSHAREALGKLQPPIAPVQQPQPHIPAAAPHPAEPRVGVLKQHQYAVGSENEAPPVPLCQAQGVAVRPRLQELKQPGEKAALQQIESDVVHAKQQPRQQHREPLRVVQAPSQQQQQQQQQQQSTHTPPPVSIAAVPQQPEIQHPVIVEPQQQQVHHQQQQQQVQAQQQPVAAMNTAASSTPDLRAAPPERLPEPQRRAMEDANWVYVSGLRYQKLDCVGRGGSSKVFKVLGCNRQIYALKRVRLANKDPEAIRGFIDEITLLKQLRNTPNIIQLISAQVFREECLIYMVLEYGDIDLARLLQNHEQARRQQAASGGGAASSGGGSTGEIDENFIRLYWQQMLQAVGGIHEMRIVHSDLKPANFLLVQGQLKLIDFGIAKSIQGDTTSINRESQVGTLNYMSPEAIQGGSSNPLGGAPLKVGRPSDVWSLGCILYQMVYGQTPFADIPFIPKMNAICNPGHVIRFASCANPAAADAMARCLDREPRTRITIPELLDHAFLHPERATAPKGGVSEEQLKSIVSQIALAGATGTADIDTLTRQVLAQLQSQQPADSASASSSQQSKPTAPPPSHKHPPPARQHPVRPPTPARCPVPLSPGDEPCPASPMDADTPPRHAQASRGQEDAGDAAVATPQRSGASAAAASLERLHFDDECSS